MISKLKLIFLVLAYSTILSLAPARAYSGDEVPGKRQSKPVALVNGTVHTVSNGTAIATVVFDNGKIVAIGKDVAIPQDAIQINCEGKHVYPGFFAPATTLGLTELDAVRATRDMNETGDINPNVRAEAAYNPDSDLIPTIRSNGILLANVMPAGGLVSGSSSLMRLDGWTREDIAVLARSAMVVNWPSMNTINAWWMRKTPEEQRKESAERVRDLYDVFKKARAYALAQNNNVDTATRDIRFESMRAIFDKKLPLIINATTRVQIEAAIAFKREFDVNVILRDAADAPLILDEIRKANIGIIIDRVHALPRRDEDPYDAPFTLPTTLAAAGIPFAFSDDGAWQQRNVPFHAGTAMAFGLSEEHAEKALTLWPAQLFGVADKFGSLDVGKSATLFVSKGMALDALTNNVEACWIDGRSIVLDNKHKKLSRKYRARYR